MKFVLAMHGSRGDVEPCAAVGVELARRGHQVCVAVPPNLVGFAESAGLTAVEYGPDSQQQSDDEFVRNPWKVQSPASLVRAFKAHVTQGWSEMSTTVLSLADGADLVLTGTICAGVAAKVAESYRIPLAVLHYFPMRPNGQLVSSLPSPLVRGATSGMSWLYWRMTKDADDAQRRELGLPRVEGSLTRRIADRGSLEIQAYDELCFPGLAAEWAGRFPFVGALTMDLPSQADDEVASWIAAGTPPIYFGFGSMPVRSPAETVSMIGAACAELGERALICSGWADFDSIPHAGHVKVVRAVNHSAIFPSCRAVVHHGGAGTTAAGMRAGIPTLILWITSDQPVWAAQVKRLKVGSGRRFSATTQKSLTEDLRTILAPDYAARARDVASRMTKPAASVTAAVDLLEDRASSHRGAVGGAAT
jgi:UDP:flavonoid glycosyltransferase YjiC (YdhE family)